MNYNAYLLTGDAKADTRALRAWGLGVTVSNEGGELTVEVNNPSYWVTGCCGYRRNASVGNLVVFPVGERNPMCIKIIHVVTADDAPTERGEQ